MARQGRGDTGEVPLRRLMVGVPVYRGALFVNFVHSLLRLQDAAARANLLVDVQITDGSTINHSRNLLLAEFLDSDATHLLYCDSDVGFEPEEVFRMLDHEVECVAGTYWVRSIDLAGLISRPDPITYENEAWSVMCRPTGWIISNEEGSPKETEAGLVECLSVPAGMLMLSRAAVDRLLSADIDWYRSSWGSEGTIPRIWREPESLAVNMTEDVEFCRLFRSLGGTIYTDPTLRPTHFGTFTSRGPALTLGTSEE